MDSGEREGRRRRYLRIANKGKKRKQGTRPLLFRTLALAHLADRDIRRCSGGGGDGAVFFALVRGIQQRFRAN